MDAHNSAARQLTAAEARVLGSLMEKSVTTPEYYPLSLNALVNACNQKSSREPVMQLSDSDAHSALLSLERDGLVRHVPDSRVSKWEHATGGKWNLGRAESAVLCVLLLRGAQTPGELRMRTERLFPFEELEAVNAALGRLAARTPSMAEVLPRQPGSREQRWRELVSEHEASTPSTAVAEPSQNEIAELRNEIAELRLRVEKLEASPEK